MKKFDKNTKLKKVWTVIAPDDMELLKQYKKDNGFTTLTGVVYYILDNHKGFKNDYFYNSKTGVKMVLTITEKDYKKLLADADKNNITCLTKYIRFKVTSFLMENTNG